jgi:hypothetical protein
MITDQEFLSLMALKHIERKRYIAVVEQKEGPSLEPSQKLAFRRLGDSSNVV